MSYDIQIYSCLLPDGHAGVSSLEWQITVNGPFVLELEDIPSQVRTTLPGIQFRLDLHLEGIAPDSAYVRLRSLAQRIAKQIRGVVVDEQAGTVETPRGVRRLEPDPVAVDDEDNGLQLSWFFLDTASFVGTHLDAMIDLMNATLPEALPRRYGLYEPPQHRLDRDGMAHFRAFFRQHLQEGIVWYCTKPFEHAFVSIPDFVGATRRGFRSARISFDVSASALRAAGWRTELSRFWLGLARLLNPFYAEIREGGCPTKSWWWNGVPRESAQAVVLGAPYTDRWPEFTRAATRASDDLFVINTLTDPAVPLPPVPPVIAQPADRRIEVDPLTGQVLATFVFSDIKYPSEWPFEGPLVSNRPHAPEP